mgnify:FL=1
MIRPFSSGREGSTSGSYGLLVIGYWIGGGETDGVGVKFGCVIVSCAWMAVEAIVEASRFEAWG